MVSPYSETIKVQLYISCRKLKDVETFSKSDPFVEVFLQESSQSWTKLGQTEVIWDNLNPDFVKYFSLDYYFEQNQLLLFKVFDANIENGREVKGEQIGEVECSLGEVAGARGQKVIKTLRLGNSNESTGNIILRIEQVLSPNMSEVCINFAGIRIKETGWGLCCSLNPMFCLSRVIEHGFQRVYLSETSRGKGPIWRPMVKTMHDLCNSDENQLILFELFDHRRNGNHKLMGKFQFSIKMMFDGVKVFQLFSDHSREVGEIHVNFFGYTEVHDFLEFIAGGCQINLLIAVDFTESNRVPTDMNSLHFISRQGYNLYQSALHSVSEILLHYDSDKQVPLYGFGAKINGAINHCFPLNLDESNPDVTGLSGIMDAYKAILPQITFSGPTYFSPVIKSAVTIAEQAHVNQNNQQYFILLILTDGEIHDMSETIDWIVKGSQFPLSIVIVGIGNAKFDKMEILDADDNPLINSKGIKMTRDIVQFVPFRNFRNSSAALTREVLAEIPREITNYFKIMKIVPNPPILSDFPNECTDPNCYPENQTDLQDDYNDVPAVNFCNNDLSKE